jgi:DNA-binding SARP family transcriptional activator
MMVGLLGPLRVMCEQREIMVPAAKQRAILAALAARAGKVVSHNELVDVLWGGAPPPSADVTLRNYLMRLRRQVGVTVGTRILTRPTGHVLDVEQDEVDVFHYIDLCQAGAAALRRGDWPIAWDELVRAQALWRGEPLQDVPSDALRRDHLPWLQQWHCQAAEWRVDAGLQLGRHGELIPELRMLITAQPLREHLRAQLIYAQFRAYRRADALCEYRDVRRFLCDELGIEPGRELRILHAQILAGDDVRCPAPTL